MPRIEYATGAARDGFPPSWGRPPGEPHSETRANWVRLQVAKFNPDAPDVAARRPQVDRANELYGQAAEAREAGRIDAAERLSRLGDMIRRP